MKIDCLILGAYETNCYILRTDDNAGNCLIIDTGLEAGELIAFLDEHSLTPQAIVLTHGHADHIMGIPPLREKFDDIKVYIHKLDAQMLAKPTKNLSLLAGKFFKTEPADLFLDESDAIEAAGIKLKILHTPGHTPGGVCLYSMDDGIIFTGDTLFADSVGRTDFPGSNTEQLIKGIREKLLPLPEETICYPGHGPSTTIGREKEFNPFLK